MSGNFPPMLVDNRSILDAEEVASYKNYHDAQKAVDRLEQAGFSIANLAIIGKDVRTVEQILGRLSVGKEFLAGFVTGIAWGLFAVLVLLLAVPTRQGSVLFFGMMVLGLALFSGLMRALMFAFSSRRHGFASARTTIAQEYTIVAAKEAMRARQILGVVRAQTPISQGNGPTPFGSRPDEQPRFGVRVNQVPPQSQPGTVPAPQGGAQWGAPQTPLPPAQESGMMQPPAFGVRVADYLEQTAGESAGANTQAVQTPESNVADASSQSEVACTQSEDASSQMSHQANPPAQTAQTNAANAAEAEAEEQPQTGAIATFPARRSERRQHHEAGE